MKTLIYAYGSRGDIQPYIALAAALNKAGHHAMLAAPAKFEALAGEYDVEFFPRNEDLIDLFLNDPDIITWMSMANRRGPEARKLRKTVHGRLAAELRRCLPIMLRELVDAAAGDVDLVVQAYGAWPYEQGHHVAERLGVPAVLGTLDPSYLPSWHYPAKFVPSGRRYPPLVRRLSHVPPTAQQLAGRQTVDRWRADTLGLPPRRGRHNRLRRPDGGPAPVIQGFSANVLPPAPDWPESVVTTGFWFTQATPGVAISEDLARFVAGGEPPVCVSLGSVRGMDPVAAGQIVVDAIRLADVRAVVVRASGSLEVTDGGTRAFVVDEVPYRWLFPKTCLVVHAAGLGTSNEALREGVPQVSCPVSNEQLMWGTRLHEIGVAPAPLRAEHLTADDLAASIRRALADPAMRARAEQMGEAVRAEDGTGKAVLALESVEREFRRASSAG
ncbi:glycosyltransferase [Amycolatopsis sp. NPDC059090]|uniref:glycosyltransferase n=1 Tax=unclassified Amycolatopsis TaxID=2618356 RepID=UPI003670969B